MSLTERAQRFDREQSRSLRALAYRMLGSRTEAEDIIQEAWLRWAEVDLGGVQHEGAYLSRLVTNLCLDKLQSAAARREQYVGVWLPEPLVDEAQDWAPSPETQAEYAQDVSIAFMLALERLSPLERAAFLLHEVFELDFDEIARRLDRTPAACRQLASRARTHVKAQYARREVEEEERQRLFVAFADALQRRDVEALARVLAEDAVLLSDGGGKVAAVPYPLAGGLRIATALVGFAKGAVQWRIEPAHINGLVGCLVFGPDGQLLQTFALAPAADGAHIGSIYVQRNPDKLSYLRATRGAANPAGPDRPR